MRSSNPDLNPPAVHHRGSREQQDATLMDLARGHGWTGRGPRQEASDTTRARSAWDLPSVPDVDHFLEDPRP